MEMRENDISSRLFSWTIHFAHLLPKQLQDPSVLSMLDMALAPFSNVMNGVLAIMMQAILKCIQVGFCRATTYLRSAWRFMKPQPDHLLHSIRSARHISTMTAIPAWRISKHESI